MTLRFIPYAAVKETFCFTDRAALRKTEYEGSARVQLRKNNQYDCQGMLFQMQYLTRLEVCAKIFRIMRGGGADDART